MHEFLSALGSLHSLVIYRYRSFIRFIYFKGEEKFSFVFFLRTHRYYVPPQTVAIALHLTDRRRLSAVHPLLPIVLDLRGRPVLVVVVVVIRSRVLSLSQLPLGDLRDRRRRARNRDRLPLDRPLLLLLLLLVT